MYSQIQQIILLQAIIVSHFSKLTSENSNCEHKLQRTHRTGPFMAIGLTHGEKRFLLDKHNDIRENVASGCYPEQPTASDMISLEWSNMAASHAQTWANDCGGKVNIKTVRKGSQLQNRFISRNRSDLFSGAFAIWFNRKLPKYYYEYGIGKNSYTTISASFITKIGCGANWCPRYRYARLACNYQIAINSMQNLPYKVGNKCTKCPPKFGYCKNGNLCASAEACKLGQDTDCRCTVSRQKCIINGLFKNKRCYCECKRGWKGLNCEIACRDDIQTITRATNNNNTNKCGIFLANRGCERGNAYYAYMMLYCQETCGFCNKM